MYISAKVSDNAVHIHVLVKTRGGPGVALLLLHSRLGCILYKIVTSQEYLLNKVYLSPFSIQELSFGLDI